MSDLSEQYFLNKGPYPEGGLHLYTKMSVGSNIILLEEIIGEIKHFSLQKIKNEA